MRPLISFRGVLYFLDRAFFVIGCVGRNSIDPICINFSQSHRFHSIPDLPIMEVKPKKIETINGEIKRKQDTEISTSLTNKSLFMSHVKSKTVLGSSPIALSPLITIDIYAKKHHIEFYFQNR